MTRFVLLVARFTFLVALANVVPMIATSTLAATDGGSCADSGGQPGILEFSIGETGTDFDLGWTGVEHAFPMPANARVRACLADCDVSTHPLCTLQGPTGAATINGAVLGPPVPLLAANVPLCLVQRHGSGGVTGTFSLATGRLEAHVPLTLETYFTDTGKVCPRCVGGGKVVGALGTCDSGPSQGATCRVESVLRVQQASVTDKEYELSSDCLPAGDGVVPDGTQSLELTLTTETAGPLAGGASVPCGQDPGNPKAVLARDNDCSGSCDATCSGLACVTKDAANRCIDDKGGINSTCCSNRTTLPCFPVGISRTGSRAQLTPQWPGSGYPKSGPAELVAVFCHEATDNQLINAASGFPGPAALRVPGSVTVDIATTTTSTTAMPTASTTTTVPRCGNGIREVGEECDLGNLNGAPEGEESCCTSGCTRRQPTFVCRLSTTVCQANAVCSTDDGTCPASLPGPNDQLCFPPNDCSVGRCAEGRCASPTSVCAAKVAPAGVVSARLRLPKVRVRCSGGETSQPNAQCSVEAFVQPSALLSGLADTGGRPGALALTTGCLSRRHSVASACPIGDGEARYCTSPARRLRAKGDRAVVCKPNACARALIKLARDCKLVAESAARIAVPKVRVLTTFTGLRFQGMSFDDTTSTTCDRRRCL